MALQLDKITDTGVVGSYWKITNIRRDAYRNITVFDVSLYINKDARDSGKSPLDVNSYIADSIDWVNSENNIVTDCYNYLKTLAEFSTAVDA